MAKVPTISLKSEDFADLLSDYPEVDGLLRNVNRFGVGTSAALNRGLTVAENVSAQIAEVTISDGATPAISVALKLPQGRKVQGVTVIQGRDITNRSAPAAIGGAPWVDWHEDGGKLVIEGITGLTASRKYQLRLLIWGE